MCRVPEGIAFFLVASSLEIAAQFEGSFCPSTNTTLQMIYELEQDDYTVPLEKRGVKMVLIKGGSFFMGSSEFGTDEKSGEMPERLVYLNDFYLDETPVTNQDFVLFVLESGENAFETTAELITGSSVIFEQQLNTSTDHRGGKTPLKDFPWLVEVKGLSWQTPSGPGSSWFRIANHPVVHVSWEDAKRYCEWTGKRLPTEAEWEHSCRAGKARKNFPWGNKPTYFPDHAPPSHPELFVVHRMNVWQGHFPTNISAEDGYLWTSPVKAFEHNDFFVYDMTGNVWEWVSDYWHVKHPAGPLYNPRPPKSAVGGHTMKGGSYLCPSIECCSCSSRRGASAYYSASDLGFRCAKSVIP